jgi:hypothetical protein
MPRAYKAHPDHPAVDYLVRLHGDLGGQIHANRKEAKRLADAMKHVEAVIRLFDPAYDVRRIAVRRRQRLNKWFKRGKMFPAALDALRANPMPMTVRELARVVLINQGEPEPDLKTLRTMEGGMRACLANKEGKTVERVGEGMPAKWRLIHLP